MKKKPLSVAAAALAAVMLTTGCGQTASSVASSAAASSEIASSVAESTVSAEETSYPLTLQIYDADGNAVDMTYDHAPEKVLSTQLSMTELLWHRPILSGTGHSRLYRVGQCFHGPGSGQHRRRCAEHWRDLQRAGDCKRLR